MQINRCPRCILKPESEICFKFDMVINKMCFVGWRISCINCCFNTDIYETIDEAVAKWNELTEIKDGKNQ
jgi:hypothetical protein